MLVKGMTAPERAVDWRGTWWASGCNRGLTDSFDGMRGSGAGEKKSSFRMAWVLRDVRGRRKATSEGFSSLVPDDANTIAADDLFGGIEGQSRQPDSASFLVEPDSLFFGGGKTVIDLRKYQDRPL